MYGEWGECLLPAEPDLRSAWLAVRAEHVQLAPHASCGITAQVVETYELGMTRIIVCRLRGGETIQKFQGLDQPAPGAGDKVCVILPQTQVRALPQCGEDTPQSSTSLHVVTTPDELKPRATQAR